MKVIAVVPAWNEEPVIHAVLMKLRPHVDEVVVVDDGSQDLTYEQAKKSGVIVLKHIVNRGQGAALQTGTEYARQLGADIIVHFDADGQSPEHQISALIEPIKNGEVEVVLGSRFLDQTTNIPRVHRITLLIANFFTRVMSGLKLTDSHCGFRAIHKDATCKLKMRQDAFAHASEILQLIARNKLKYKEVPVSIRYTEYSNSRGQASVNDVLNAIRIIIDLIKGSLL